MAAIIIYLLISVLNTNAQEYERYKVLLDTTISSKQLGYDRPITVTVPFEWQQDLEQDFPLIVVFDRQNQRSHNYILNTIDYLTSNEQMPSCVIISIASDQEHRYIETLFKASDAIGMAEANEAFLFDELLPLAEKQFKANKFRLFIGHSRYGYFTSALLCSKADQLNGIISISPVFEQKNVRLTDSLSVVMGTEHAHTVYYRFGIGNDYPEDFRAMEPIIGTIKNEKLNFKGQLFKDADHNATPGLVIATALYDVFEYWSVQQSAYIRGAASGPSAIPDLEANIKNHYGKPLRFSLGILNGKAWEHFNNAEYDKAIDAWNLLLQHYPNFSETYLYIMESKLNLSQDVSSLAGEFNKNLSSSCVYTEAEKSELLAEFDSLMRDSTE
jgi:hypothetical protein